MTGFSAAQAIIGAMITPELLILASDSLIAAALVRLARVVDRVRHLAAPGAPPVSAEELRRNERRALLAGRALQIYFFAVVCLVVAGVAIGVDHFAGDRLTCVDASLNP